MTIIGKKLSLPEFTEYVRSFNFGTIKPSSLVLHHTWSPKKSEWSGEKSIQGLKSYYEGLGWSAGPHLFIAEDGIWLFTPMSEIGIHAGEGNATWERLGKEVKGYSKPVGGKLKSYSIGIEVVGDYDKERWSGATYTNAFGAIRILMEVLGINNEGIFFHRDFSSKTCPGAAITKDWFFSELGKRDAAGLPASIDMTAISPWAREAFYWQIENDLDRSVLPHQKVDAEWVFAMLYRYHKKLKNNEIT